MSRHVAVEDHYKDRLKKINNIVKWFLLPRDTIEEMRRIPEIPIPELQGPGEVKYNQIFEVIEELSR